MLFVEECAGCGTDGTQLCEACIAALVPAGRIVPPPSGLDACVALCRYDATARRIVGSLKYRNRPGVARVLGAALATLAVPELIAGAGRAQPSTTVTTVTWVPTSATRRRRRGYDQARLLAAAVATELGCDLGALLTRGRGPAQTSCSGTERRRGVPLRARGRAAGTVVVVDDVTTTGTTFASAAAVLRGAGAAQVIGLVVARTCLALKDPPWRTEN